MRQSIRRRITGWFLLFSVIPMLAAGTIICWRLYRAQQEQALALQREVARRAVNEVLILVHEHEDKFQTLIKGFALFSRSGQERQAVLSKVRTHKDERHRDIIDAILLFDKDGRVLNAVSRTAIAGQYDLSLWPEFSTVLGVLRQGDLHYSRVRTLPDSGEPFVVLSMPFVDYLNGEVLGVLAARLRINEVWDRIVTQPFGQEGEIYIVDDDGGVVAHANRSHVLRGDSCAVDSQGRVVKGLDGERVLRAMAPVLLGQQRFFIVVDRPLTEALAPGHRAIVSIIALLLVLLGIGVAASMVAAWRLVQPIEALARTAGAITGGDLESKALVQGHDEFALLADAFNAMTDRLVSDLRNRQRAEEALVRYQEKLAGMVAERTAELQEANLLLQQEVGERQQAENVLRELLTFSRSLSSATDSTVLYRKCTSLAKQVFNFDFSTLMLLNPDKDSLIIQDTIGFSEATIGSFALLKGHGLSTYVVKEKQGATVVDFTKESRFEVPPIVHEKKISSALCVPMMLGNEVFGVLIGHTCRLRYFSDDEISLYQSFANQAAMAIKNVLHLEELAKARKLESVGVLAGGIAHDFNNILAAIMGNISLASQYLLPEEKPYSLLVEAEKASVRARDLTQQLLTFSKGGEPVKKLASIGEVIRESAAFVLRGSKVKAEYEIPEDLWPLEIDRGQMSQVIQNLIINSCQAMPEGGVISITCSNLGQGDMPILPGAPPNCVAIEIRDAGGGIPADKLPMIFDPYFTTKDDGSGLGLAITHSIVSKHGGHITVDSLEGKGTVFTIYLAASPGQGADTSVPVSNRLSVDSAPATRGGTVLVMDDDPMVRGVAESMLDHLGYNVVTAEEGRQALEVYRELMEDGQTIDLVIMDLTIPGGMGGREAVCELLAIDPQARVIVASGYSNDPVLARYKEYGFQGVVGKPFNLEELRDVLNGALV